MPDADRVRISVCGEVDLATRGSLTAVGLGAMSTPTIREVVIDLGQVTFMDASGLGSLVTIRNASLAYGKSLVLLDVPPRIASLLEVGRLLDHFTISTPAREYAHPTPGVGRASLTGHTQETT